MIVSVSIGKIPTKLVHPVDKITTLLLSEEVGFNRPSRGTVGGYNRQKMPNNASSPFIKILIEYVSNKGVIQPTHQRSLLSIFVVAYL